MASVVYPHQQKSKHFFPLHFGIEVNKENIVQLSTKWNTLPTKRGARLPSVVGVGPLVANGSLSASDSRLWAYSRPSCTTNQRIPFPPFMGEIQQWNGRVPQASTRYHRTYMFKQNKRVHIESETEKYISKQSDKPSSSYEGSLSLQSSR